MIGGRQTGRSAALRWEIERALGHGQTVILFRPDGTYCAVIPLLPGIRRRRERPTE